jgi:glycine/D-amino acid oxidase-like deaminating enzyme
MSLTLRQPATRQIVVVGAGIVGAAVATELVERGFQNVTVIEQSPNRLTGSTGHAPGFVGLLNEAPVMTRLAETSVRKYRQLSHEGLSGFAGVGGIEAATTAAGLAATWGTSVACH